MARREVKTLTGSTGAISSDCEVYRYLLWRIWDDTLPTALLLMMNPSTANEIENDSAERDHLIQWFRFHVM